MYYANRRQYRTVDRSTVAQRCLLLTADLHSCMILARMILCHVYITCTYTRYFPFDSSIRTLHLRTVLFSLRATASTSSFHVERDGAPVL
jgi:hypothetical protein